MPAASSSTFGTVWGWITGNPQLTVFAALAAAAIASAALLGLLALRASWRLRILEHVVSRHGMMIQKLTARTGRNVEVPGLQENPHENAFALPDEHRDDTLPSQPQLLHIREELASLRQQVFSDSDTNGNSGAAAGKDAPSDVEAPE